MTLPGSISKQNVTKVSKNIEIDKICNFVLEVLPEKSTIFDRIYVFAHFCTFLYRTGPRECHNRILRIKLCRIDKFSSKSAPRQPSYEGFKFSSTFADSCATKHRTGHFHVNFHMT